MSANKNSLPRAGKVRSKPHANSNQLGDAEAHPDKDPKEVRRLKKQKHRLKQRNQRLGAKVQKLISDMPGRWRGTKYIYSEDYSFVYILTPKVASTSILNSLLYLFDFDLEQGDLENLKKGVPINRVHKLFKGSPYQMNKATFLAGMSDKFHRCFKFAFVRNPWDRLVSCYASKIVVPGTGLRMGNYGDVALEHGMPFRKFAEAVCQIPDEEANLHFRSQHVFVCEDSPAKRVLADFVGRFENLEEDFSFVTKTLGFSAKLPHTVNMAKVKDSQSYRDSYDDRLARMVGERYRQDAEMFGYTF